MPTSRTRPTKTDPTPARTGPVTAGPVRILGIDPGSRNTGWGVIDAQPRGSRFIACGAIRVTGDMALRLRHIHEQLTDLIDEWQPQISAIEKVFLGRSFDSALKLGQARGVALCALALADLPIHEYAPRAIKQAVVGTGAADKAQVQHMIHALLNPPGKLNGDAADALAVAVCHAHHAHTSTMLAMRAAGAAR